MENFRYYIPRKKKITLICYQGEYFQTEDEFRKFLTEQKQFSPAVANTIIANLREIDKETATAVMTKGKVKKAQREQLLTGETVEKITTTAKRVVQGTKTRGGETQQHAQIETAAETEKSTTTEVKSKKKSTSKTAATKTTTVALKKKTAKKKTAILE